MSFLDGLSGARSAAEAKVGGLVGRIRKPSQSEIPKSEDKLSLSPEAEAAKAAKQAGKKQKLTSKSLSDFFGRDGNKLTKKPRQNSSGDVSETSSKKSSRSSILEGLKRFKRKETSSSSPDLSTQGKKMEPRSAGYVPVKRTSRPESPVQQEKPLPKEANTAESSGSASQTIEQEAKAPEPVKREGSPVRRKAVPERPPTKTSKEFQFSVDEEGRIISLAEEKAEPASVIDRNKKLVTRKPVADNGANVPEVKANLNEERALVPYFSLEKHVLGRAKNPEIPQNSETSVLKSLLTKNNNPLPVPRIQRLDLPKHSFDAKTGSLNVNPEIGKAPLPSQGNPVPSIIRNPKDPTNPDNSELMDRGISGNMEKYSALQPAKMHDPKVVDLDEVNRRLIEQTEKDGFVTAPTSPAETGYHTPFESSVEERKALAWLKEEKNGKEANSNTTKGRLYRGFLDRMEQDPAELQKIMDNERSLFLEKDRLAMKWEDHSWKRSKIAGEAAKKGHETSEARIAKARLMDKLLPAQQEAAVGKSIDLKTLQEVRNKQELLSDLDTLKKMSPKEFEEAIDRYAARFTSDPKQQAAIKDQYLKLRPEPRNGDFPLYVLSRNQQQAHVEAGMKAFESEHKSPVYDYEKEDYKAYSARRNAHWEAERAQKKALTEEAEEKYPNPDVFQGRTDGQIGHLRGPSYTKRNFDFFNGLGENSFRNADPRSKAVANEKAPQIDDQKGWDQYLEERRAIDHDARIKHQDTLQELWGCSS